jgi:hypothetical protein
MKNILKSNRNYTPKQTIITLKHTADGSNVLMKLKNVINYLSIYLDNI